MSNTKIVTATLTVKVVLEVPADSVDDSVEDIINELNYAFQSTANARVIDTDLCDIASIKDGVHIY